MPKTKEDLVATRIMNQLDILQRWYNNNFGSPLAKSGVPDFITMDSNARFLAIECKREGKAPEMNQWKHAFEIIESGGRYLIAQEDVDLIESDFPVLRVIYDKENIGQSSFNASKKFQTLHGTHEVVLVEKTIDKD